MTEPKSRTLAAIYSQTTYVTLMSSALDVRAPAVGVIVSRWALLKIQWFIVRSLAGGATPGRDNERDGENEQSQAG